MTYSFDNYTNEGCRGSLAVTKNLIVQFGLIDGTETAIWNVGKRVKNPASNPYPGAHS